MGSVPQREADLLPLWTALTAAASPSDKAQATAALEAELARRAAINRNVRAAVADMLMQPEVVATVEATFANQNLLLPRLEADAMTDLLSNEALEAFVSRPLPRGHGRPVVDSFDCLREMVAAWEGACGKLDQYGMQYTRTFANLCNAGVAPGMLHASAVKTCPVQAA
jgi:legumain